MTAPPRDSLVRRTTRSKTGHSYTISYTIFVLCMFEAFSWTCSVHAMPSSHSYLSRSVENRETIQTKLASGPVVGREDILLRQTAKFQQHLLQQLQRQKLIAEAAALSQTANPKDIATSSSKQVEASQVQFLIGHSQTGLGQEGDVSGDADGEGNANGSEKNLSIVEPLTPTTTRNKLTSHSVVSSFFDIFSWIETIFTNPEDWTNLSDSVVIAISLPPALESFWKSAKQLIVTFVGAFLAVLKVLIVVAGGTYLARTGALLPEGNRSLGKCVFNLMLPCLLFVSMATSLDLKQSLKFLSVVFYAFLYPVLGYFLGIIVLKISKPPKHLERGIVMAVTFGNAAFLPLSLTATVMTLASSPFATVPNAENDAISYISIFVSVFSLIYWTVSPAYMGKQTPPPAASTELGPSEDDKDEPDSLTCLDPSSDDERIEEGPFEMCAANREEEEGLDTFALSFFMGLDGQPAECPEEAEPEEAPLEDPDQPCRGLARAWRKGRRLCRRALETAAREHVRLLLGLAGVGRTAMEQLLSPPTVAVGLGFCVGLLGPLRWLFFGPSSPEATGVFSGGAPLGFVTYGLTTLGSAALPCAMLVLGANLAHGPASVGLSRLVVGCVALAKLVVLPLLGILVTLLLSHFGLLPDDPVLKFVLMIEGATPSAMSLVIICQMSGAGEQEMSSLQFWIYIFSAISLTFFVSLYLYIL